ncbi:alpha/beta fold hydrolase [Halobacillus amylolyticus]|uniref:Alpha/beta fold hydrolase n=1 Tax=Halobacillus amylolyticus TaxID=2932259 RepID=A0ABY4HA82_9BACI|nr:alpha/beta fold hydrolase [Halobacillus amylolyticus]UOR11208.1 alpha/beta fold hydrolase [Halobacillus amylolyticus]
MKEFQKTIEQHTFHVYTEGREQLPALVCLHGVTADSKTFTGMVEHMKNHFHLILLDGPGHGRTRPLVHEEDYAFSFLAKRLDQVIMQLTSKPFFIMGHSWGADLALHYTKAFPEKIEGVILLDGGYVFPEHVPGLTKEKALSAWGEYSHTSVYSSWGEFVDTYQGYTTKKWDDTLDLTIASNFKKEKGKYRLVAESFSLLSMIKAFYREPSSTAYTDINCPTLLFHAALPLTDKSRKQGLRQIQESIPDLKVIGIKNTKHNVHWDAPEKVSQEIKLWIGNDILEVAHNAGKIQNVYTTFWPRTNDSNLFTN